GSMVKLGRMPGGHVLDVLGHPHGEVVLSNKLRVAGPELKQMLLELVVAEKCIRVVRGVVDNSDAELRRGRANAQSDDDQQNQNLSFHRSYVLSSFLPSRDRKAFCGCCNRAARDRRRDRLLRDGLRGLSPWAGC